MKVRFIRAWQNYPKGMVIEPAALLRNELIARNLVEVVKESAERADAAPPENAMKQRGRPRKVVA